MTIEEWAKNPAEYIDRLRRETNLPDARKCGTCRFEGVQGSDEPCLSCLGLDGRPNYEAARGVISYAEAPPVEVVAQKNLIEHHLRGIEQHVKELRQLIQILNGAQ